MTADQAALQLAQMVRLNQVALATERNCAAWRHFQVTRLREVVTAIAVQIPTAVDVCDLSILRAAKFITVFE